jgi:hypothetical protein
MHIGKINLITAPDRLYNSNISYLLVKPSAKLKIQFQHNLKQIDDDVNVYIFDDTETDIDWLLSVGKIADFIIVDIDNCDYQTKLFISLLLIQPNSYYLTSDESTPWSLISRNRIFNLDWVLEVLNGDDEEDDA